MNILIINVHSSKNAGDHLLNHNAIQLLKERFPEAIIRILSNDPDPEPFAALAVSEIPSFLSWMKREGGERWAIRHTLQLLFSLLAYRVFPKQLDRQLHSSRDFLYRETFEAFEQADMVISCPGNFLYSSGTLRLPLLMSMFTIYWATFRQKPTYLFSQTIGPFRATWEKRLMKRLLGRLRLIFVRDEISYRLVVDEFGESRDRCFLVPDVVFGTPRPSVTAGHNLLSKYEVDLNHSPLIGFTGINWGGQNRAFHNQRDYEAGLAAAADAVIESFGAHVVLFSQVFGPGEASDDRIIAQRVFNQLSHQSQATLITDRHSAEELMSAYGLMDFFVGSRLHSNIFASISNVPLLAIQYQPKTLGIMTMLGLPDLVIRIEEVNPTSLVPKLDSAFRERDRIYATIESKLSNLHQQVHQMVAKIENDFNAL